MLYATSDLYMFRKNRQISFCRIPGTLFHISETHMETFQNGATLICMDYFMEPPNISGSIPEIPAIEVISSWLSLLVIARAFSKIWSGEKGLAEQHDPCCEVTTMQPILSPPSFRTPFYLKKGTKKECMPEIDFNQPDMNKTRITYLGMVPWWTRAKHRHRSPQCQTPRPCAGKDPY